MSNKLDFYIEKNLIRAPGRSYVQEVVFKKNDKCIVGYYFNDDDLSADWFGLALSEDEYGDVSISFFKTEHDSDPVAMEAWALGKETKDYPYIEYNQNMRVFDIIEWCVDLLVGGSIPYHGAGMDPIERIDQLPQFLLRKMSQKVIKEMSEDLYEVIERSRRGEIETGLMEYYTKDFYLKGLYLFLNDVLKKPQNHQ